LSTVKVFVLMAVPLGVVTLMNPDPALVGTMVVIKLSESTVKAATVPFKTTAEAAVNWLPVMLTLVPALPLVGQQAKKVVGRIGLNQVAAVVLELQPDPGIVSGGMRHDVGHAEDQIVVLRPRFPSTRHLAEIPEWGRIGSDTKYVI
jgi:hypothetical protein